MADDATGEPLPELTPSRLLRYVRRARRLSQRELAGLAALPASTVDRIEAGRSEPRFGTLVRLLAAAGYSFVVADWRGGLLDVTAHDRLVDRGGRRFPAHLKAIRYEGLPWQWWGLSLVGWNEKDPRIPPYVYYLRPRRWYAPGDGPWLDAT